MLPIEMLFEIKSVQESLRYIGKSIGKVNYYSSPVNQLVIYFVKLLKAIM